MIFTLKASELGLGTVIMRIYDEEPIKPKIKNSEELLKFI